MTISLFIINSKFGLCTLTATQLFLLILALYTCPRLAEAIGLLGNSSNKIFAGAPSSFSTIFKAIL